TPSTTSRKGGLTAKKHQKALHVWLKTHSSSVDALLAGKEVAAIYDLTVEINEVEREITKKVSDAVPTLLAMPGCGALSAAKLLGESADITRFPGEAQFARH
ncbi:IS110 family transposase, partial [Gordonia terrae]